MRLYVHHDDAGRVRSATWYEAPEGAGMALAPAPGERVVEIAGHGLEAGAAPDAVRKAVRGMVVAAATPTATLAPARRAAKKKR
jgi:hypothetical protein